jgi:dipeptidyl aminopeptidase/acylaminoacyl peptidase
MAHFLATRGYAVFRPALRQLKRFRDVSGMDELGEWILDVQEDINAGIGDLAARGIVDFGRVCIAGEDEEAYTALISTVYSSDVYRCAISVNGMTDLQRIVRWARYFNDNPVNSYNSALIRNYDHYAQEDLVRFSPIHHAAEVQASHLLIGDNMDDHTESMLAALRSVGKQVQYVETRYNGDEPALYRQENQSVRYGAIETFLAAELGGN